MNIFDENRTFPFWFYTWFLVLKYVYVHVGMLYCVWTFLDHYLHCEITKLFNIVWYYILTIIAFLLVFCLIFNFKPKYFIIWIFLKVKQNKRKDNWFSAVNIERINMFNLIRIILPFFWYDTNKDLDLTGYVHATCNCPIKL